MDNVYTVIVYNIGSVPLRYAAISVRRKNGTSDNTK